MRQNLQIVNDDNDGNTVYVEEPLKSRQQKRAKPQPLVPLRLQADIAGGHIEHHLDTVTMYQ